MLSPFALGIKKKGKEKTDDSSTEGGLFFLAEEIHQKFRIQR